ncbi:Sov1 [Kluyveromyces lactis]|nr:Sov1 [Kluyveromyces lactis]
MLNVLTCRSRLSLLVTPRQLRYIRTKSLSNTISTIKKNADNAMHIQEKQDIAALKKHDFTEVDINSGVNSWFLSYLAVTNPGFKKSKKNLRKLKKQKETTLKDVVEYLLLESENEIKRLQTMSPEEINRHFTQNKDSEIFDESTDIENLDEKIIQQVVYDEMKPKLHALTNTNHLLDLLEKTLSDTSVVDKSQIISLDQMVQAFELSKLIPNLKYRLRGQYLTGQLIYGLKKVRLDPGNESFYIDSLLHFRKLKTAAALFESYKLRVNERWWYEVGMMVYLRSNKFHKFNNLYLETMDKFGKDYIRPDVILSAIRKLLFVRHVQKARQLTDHLLSMVKTYGWAEDYTSEAAAGGRSTGLMSRNGFLNFNSSEEANSFLNEKQKVSKKDYLSMISSYIIYGFSKEGMQLFANFEQSTKMDGVLFNTLIVKLRLQWLKEFDSFGKALEPYLSPDEATKKLEQLKGWYNEAMEKHNFSKVRNSFSYLLYGNVNDLVRFRRVSDVLQQYLLDFFSAESDEQNLEFKSKKLQMIIKLLLIGDREDAALKLLSKLEEAKKEEANKDVVKKGTSVYPPVNSHHYFLFTEYYRNKSNRTAELKVEQMIQRANENKVKLNSLLLLSLLRHLFCQERYEDCIVLINRFFSTSESPGSKSCEIPPRKLYKEIWKVYRGYYRLINCKLKGSDNWIHTTVQKRKDIKSKLDYKMFDVFNKMTIEHGTLLNYELVNIVISAFTANKEWNNLFAVLCYMHDVQMLNITPSRVEYVRKGLRKDYIEQLKMKLEKRDTLDTELVRSLRFKLKEIEDKRALNNLKLTGIDDEENFQNLLADLMEYLRLINYSKDQLNEKLQQLGLNPNDLKFHRYVE